MHDPVDRWKDPNRRRFTPRPVRSEIAEIWLQFGLPEGFSMEWVLDRYEQPALRKRGRA